jgi:hypothetical protein
LIRLRRVFFSPKSRRFLPRLPIFLDRQNRSRLRVPAQLLVIMQTWNQSCQWAGSNFFLRFTPEAGEAGTSSPSRGLRGGTAGGGSSPGRGLSGRMDRGRPRHPPALLSSISRGSDRCPHRGVVAHPGGFSSFQAALRTNTPSCHGTSSNRGACRIVEQHVTGDSSFKRPGDVGTDAE